MYLVYKTDNWHSYATRDIIGAVTSKKRCLSICKQQAKKEGKKINKDQIFNLENYNQTQGYSGDGEFDFEEVDVNILL